jgi:hypothetical protein
MASTWALKPGDSISRKDLQAEFGGRTQGGIGPSKSTPNVLIFSDAESGEQHGYIDGWQGDGCFHYTGEGQRGDQQMKSGNRSILDHAREGRSLRLFQGARGIVHYVDECELAPDPPYYYTDAPETGDGPTRSVIVFRLRPKTIAPPPPDTRFAAAVQHAFGKASKRPAPNMVEEVPIEEQWTERTFINPRQEITEAERREAKLVASFRDFLRAKGDKVTRLKIIPKGEAKPLFSDIYVKSSKLLVEAKGTVERGSIRMALGQLLDYRRFVDKDTRCAILLPSKPRDDLLALVIGCGFELFWREAEGFHHATSAPSGDETRMGKI